MSWKSNFFVGLLTQVLNTGIQEDADIQTRRLYHQVNGLNLFYTFIALSVGIFSFTILSGNRAAFIMGIVQVLATCLYFSNIILNRFRMIELSKHLTIYIFEWHLFFLILLTNAWNSPILLVVVLYPLLAALVEARIFNHLLLGMLQVFLCLGLRYLTPGLQKDIETFANMNGTFTEILRMMGFVYFPVMASVIMFIIYNQNVWARESEKELMRKQELLLTNITNLNSYMNMQLVMAQRIQESIIPKSFPVTDRIQFHGLYLPKENVGGDFYDVFTIGTNKIGLAIADVSGHGVSSALITMMVKVSIHNTSNRDIKSCELMNIVNCQLCDIMEDIDNYITVFFGILDLNTMKMEYTNAGHNDVYILSDDGQVRYLCSQNTIVGKIRDSIFTSDVIKLEGNDKIVMYTDGIPEARNKEMECFSCEKLVNLLKENKHLNPEQLTNEIISEVGRFMKNNTFMDDVSILVADIIGDPCKAILKNQYDYALEQYKINNYDKAITVLTDLFQQYTKESDKCRTAFLLGMSHYKMNNFSESLKYFETAQELDPSNKKLEYNISAVRKKMNAPETSNAYEMDVI